MRPEHALLELASIRQRIEASQVFRGYRPALAAMTSLLATAAAALQQDVLRTDLPGYVMWWTSVAAVSILLTAIDLAWLWHHDAFGAERVRIRNALRALAPCLVTGALVTLVIVLARPEVGFVLPGLWSLLFAQGLFASSPFLPRAVWLVGLYYVAAGLAVFAWGYGEQAFAPWTMVVTFAVGQLLASLALYVSAGRRHAEAA